MEYLIAELGIGSFGFYEMLADYYYERGFQNRDRKKDDQYRILYAFADYAAAETGSARLGERAHTRLMRDAEQNMNPENLKRFLKKGWEIK